MLHFALNTHRTPLGLVDLLKRFKLPWPIFDITYFPFHWTTKATEPPVTFGPAFLTSLIWLYNLRMAYPDI
jgi:hypothetical protein